MADLPTRRVRLEYPDDLDPVWAPGRPEFSHAANGVSLVMPYAEPYFVHSAREVAPSLPEDLAERTLAYARQEAQHLRQHRRFNELIRARYPGVARVERWMARWYGWLDRTRSERFDLAYAAASEVIAYSLARWTERHLGELLDGAEPVPATLYLWHLAEEVEHKTAAHEAWAAFDGNRLRYAWAALVTTITFGFFVWASCLAMLAGDRRLFSPVAHWRLFRWALSVAFVLFPTQLVTCLPGHDPGDLTDPVWLGRWLAQYDPATGTIPVPSMAGPGRDAPTP